MIIAVEYNSEVAIKSRSEVWFHFPNNHQKKENEGVVLYLLLIVFVNFAQLQNWNYCIFCSLIMDYSTSGMGPVDVSLMIFHVILGVHLYLIP